MNIGNFYRYSELLNEGSDQVAETQKVINKAELKLSKIWIKWWLNEDDVFGLELQIVIEKRNLR